MYAAGDSAGNKKKKIALRSETQIITNIGYYFGLLVANLNDLFKYLPRPFSNRLLIAPNPVEISKHIFPRAVRID